MTKNGCWEHFVGKNSEEIHLAFASRSSIYCTYLHWKKNLQFLYFKFTWELFHLQFRTLVFKLYLAISSHYSSNIWQVLYFSLLWIGLVSLFSNTLIKIKFNNHHIIIRMGYLNPSKYSFHPFAKPTHHWNLKINILQYKPS